MNTTETIYQVIRHIHLAWEEKVMNVEFFSSPAHNPMKHEFLFFIKPEITLGDPTINLKAILQMMFSKFDQYGLEVRNIRILGAAYLDEYNIIAEHYGVINALSRNPLEHFTSGALESFYQIYGVAPDQEIVLGSLEFLNRYPQYTPVTLDQLWQGSSTSKLAGGTYCAKMNMQGQVIFLINGFHPRQLMHFTAKGRSVVAFTLTGNINWAVARNNFIGKTNPADALPDSLRNELFQNSQLYGLQTVSASQNGFHLSAGPVEGLIELIRYGSDYANGNIKTTSDFVFGRQLQKLFSEPEIGFIYSNPLVNYHGKKTNIFDLTEEKNNDEALEMLRKCTF